MTEPHTALDGRPRVRVDPNDIAQALTGRRHVSFSQINMWRGCPQRYWFSYVTKATPDFISASLLFGSAVHSALEVYYQAIMEDRLLGPEALLQAYEEAWADQAEGGTPIKYSKDEDAGSLQATARRLLQAFVESAAARIDGTILALEETVRACLHPDLPDVLSRVDLAYRSEGTIVVIDFKTSRCRWSTTKAAESADQLMLYRHAALGLAEEQEPRIDTAFIVLVKTKTPTIERFDVLTNERRAERTVRMMLPVWRAIAVGEPYPNPNPINCGSCPFKSQCPAFID